MQLKKLLKKLVLLSQARISMPKEKAISVADGMAQPFKVSGLLKFANYIK